MAKSEKTVLAFPQTEGVQAAAAPIPLPGLRHSGFDHLLHRGVCRPTRRLCSPTSAPTPNLSKKPKMQATGDTFPTDWSPPHIKFLTPRAQQAGRRVGTVGPQGLRRLACWVPVELEQKPQDSDPKEDLASLEELFRSTAGPGQQAAAPAGDACTMFNSEGSESYVNSLDYLLQEKREQALEQEPEKLPMQDCPDLDSLDRDEDVPLTPEHRKLVERFSMSLQVIPSVHPGETMFLPRRQPPPCILDCSYLKPRNHLEGLFFSSPPAQQLSFLRSGLLSNLYLHALACPRPLLQWLFQLLAWPPETSSAAFGLLWDLSVDGLFRQSAVPALRALAAPQPPLASDRRGEDAHMWCPELPEIREAFHSLGAHSPAWHPQAPAEHSGRVLTRAAGLSCEEQQDPVQETALDISLSYICKFLTLCALAQPGATTDANLLDLMELLCRAGLDVGLRLLPKTDLQQLLLQLLENIRQWPGKLQQLCSALSLVSDHHHNLLALVQFFPDVTSRGRRLRSQLSLVVMARMLNQQETCPLWQEKAQLLVLSRLLSCMRPSSLAQRLGSGPLPPCQEQPLPPCQEQQPRAGAELDRTVCYLCHSLLTLAGVVVSCQDITPDQWGELQLLCVQLDRHLSTRIRDSPEAMHWTALKDLAAQTAVRWQELLSCRCPRPSTAAPGKRSNGAGQGGPGLLALAGSEQDPRTWRKQRMEPRGGPV